MSPNENPTGNPETVVDPEQRERNDVQRTSINGRAQQTMEMYVLSTTKQIAALHETVGPTAKDEAIQKMETANVPEAVRKQLGNMMDRIEGYAGNANAEQPEKFALEQFYMRLRGARDEYLNIMRASGSLNPQQREALSAVGQHLSVYLSLLENNLGQNLWKRPISAERLIAANPNLQALDQQKNTLGRLFVILTASAFALGSTVIMARKKDNKNYTVAAAAGAIAFLAARGIKGPQGLNLLQETSFLEDGNAAYKALEKKYGPFKGSREWSETFENYYTDRSGGLRAIRKIVEKNGKSSKQTTAADIQEALNDVGSDTVKQAVTRMVESPASREFTALLGELDKATTKTAREYVVERVAGNVGD